MKPGKYDPPNKEEILKQYPKIRTLGEVITGRPFNTLLTQKAKEDEDASRASEEMSQIAKKRGRNTVVTPARIEIVCEVLSKGGSERAACLKASIGSTAWNHAKKAQEGLRVKIEAARGIWAKLKYERHMNALYDSQSMRWARRKALKPKPTYQANLVMWHLIVRVPLNYAAIPEDQIKTVCEQYSYSVDQWRRQAEAFSLMQKIYKKRAELRGQNPQAVQPAQSIRRFIQNSDDRNPTYGAS